ncbi:hypothetical protein [Micromonospora sp. RTGN7]|uniref:hypothetical protein n=1 Tax=Micromonospora sp. RTGN7 TaxID=3016526 RepID=UPI0029FECF61|nr:hypothetical protein [Micromonospora sp. RTGN7]
MTTSYRGFTLSLAQHDTFGVLPTAPTRQSHTIMPGYRERLSGRLLSRAWCRLAASVLVVPVRRSAPMAALRGGGQTWGRVSVVLDLLSDQILKPAIIFHA